MDRLEFTNKLWIQGKGYFLDRVLRLCAVIFLICEMLLIFIDGISFKYLFPCFIAFLMMYFAQQRINRDGVLTDVKCIIQIDDEKIVWEYKDIDQLETTKSINQKYIIYRDRIQRIMMNQEMQLLQLICSPVFQYEKKGKIINKDFKKKECTLKIYGESAFIFMDSVSRRLHINSYQ